MYCSIIIWKNHRGPCRQPRMYTIGYWSSPFEQSPHPPKYWILQIISLNRNILKSRSQLTNVDWIRLPFLTPRGCEMIREGISHSLSEKIRGDNIASDARIVRYGAQLADPRRNPEYWGEWHEFEVSHGNEETFCEMLRVKRGVQAAFSTVNYNAVEMGGSGSGGGGDGMRLKNGDADTPLTDEQAIAMLAAQEGVEGDMDMSMVIGGGNGNNDE
mmetsp:Transcript_1647/g.2355  ORF Transcript_1647/g.2355 Transcript_1647/m.2355 type:complete len:215 (+) Transcript_1647:402-1046(+)